MIDFTSGDGTLRRTNRDVGPVPALKLRGRVVGAIIDLSARVGYRVLPAVDLFLNLRWLGGGAEGTSSSPDGPGDGFVANWLNFSTVTLGATLRLEEL